ncbi:MAG TPA: hypothetical protein VF384_19625 [Planctomycetota bacterium]
MPSQSVASRIAVFALAAVLPPSLPAQDKAVVPHRTGPALRFDVAPALAALLEARHDTPDAERSVGDTAWIVLALVANGWTLRSADTLGGDMKALMAWLDLRQDKAGYFNRRGVRCARGEQLLATLAVTEAWAASVEYEPCEANTTLGIAATHEVMRSRTAPAATVDEFVGSILLARSTALSHRPVPIAQAAEILAGSRSGMTIGKVRRTDAALHLDELLQGVKHPADLTVARTWPANLLADPLHTMVAALAVSRADAKTQPAPFAMLEALVSARETEGEHAGTWAPAGGYGRIATTAMHTITLALGNGTRGLLRTR